MTAVLTPITSPRELASGPPELPGFSAASVWIMLSIIRPDLERKVRPQGAHHSGGDCALEAVRIAKGDHQLSHTDGVRVSHAGRNKVGGVDPDYGQVGFGIVAHSLGPQAPPRQ